MTPDVIDPLADAIRRANPHLVIISGDFVQSATQGEFELARAFVNQLPKPVLAVPGNHDLPFYDLPRRFRQGLSLYRKYISPDLEPFYRDGEIAVMGVNTARVWPIRGGRINEEQVRRIERDLCSLDPWLTKVLVTHHPFDLGDIYPDRELVGRARMAMARFAKVIDLLLAGHMHVGHSGSTAVRYRIQGNSAIFVQAGTATSTRGRGEPNSFNLIRIDRPTITVEEHHWFSDRGRFETAGTQRFKVIDPTSCPVPELSQPQLP